MAGIENLAREVGLPGVIKEYIGDGVYADYDGYHVILTTENGMEATNRIALEGPVVERLQEYVSNLQHALRKADLAHGQTGTV